MGLLDKTNPAATRESVLRAAKISGAIAGVIYLIACLWSPTMIEQFFVLFPLWVGLMAAVGGLLEWQPMDMTDIGEVIRRAENEFEVRVPESKCRQIESAGQLYDAVLAELRVVDPARFDSDPDYDATIWERLKTMLVCILGVDPEEVVPAARFHYELQ